VEIIEAQVEGKGIKFEVVREKWPRPTIMNAIFPEHSVLFFLPPIEFSGEGCFPEFGKSQFRPIASFFFRPANIHMESRGTGGETRVIRYTFSPERVRTIADCDVEWGRRELETGLDLHRSLLGPILMRLMQEVVSPGFASHALVDGLGVTAIVELLRHLHDEGASKGERGRLRSEKIALIRERVMTPASACPSIAELANLCGMSERTLLRLFKQSTGETIASFMRRIRINEARALLSGSDLALKQIAHRLGFASHSGFAAAFHREVGTTPFDYRRNTRRHYHSA
jgi:AraC family transcriptional regulator